MPRSGYFLCQVESRGSNHSVVGEVKEPRPHSRLSKQMDDVSGLWRPDTPQGICQVSESTLVLYLHLGNDVQHHSIDVTLIRILEL